jgi:hypothetical protein
MAEGRFPPVVEVGVDVDVEWGLTGESRSGWEDNVVSSVACLLI